MPGDAHLGSWRAGNPRTVLLATDLSARCDRPLERAIRLARQWDARLVALHVVEQVPSGEDEASVTARLKAVMFEEVTARDRGFHLEVRFGSVIDNVLEVAADVRADLIVTGIARYNELGDYLIGTTVDRLVRASAVPVLVVKGRVRRDYQKLLAATDYSDCSALALETLPAFPRAAATLIHAYDVPFGGRVAWAPTIEDIREGDRAAADEFVATLAPGIRSRLQVVTEFGPVAEVLVRAVREHGFDLAVVGTHGTGGLGRALIGSTAGLLLGALPCDVLMVPAPR